MTVAEVSKTTSGVVLRSLHRRHSKNPGEWVCVPEAFSGSNTRSGGIDLMAVGAWRSAKASGLQGAGRGRRRSSVVAYEVKVSRSDMRRDLYGYVPGEGTHAARLHRGHGPWPQKQYDALRLTNYFVFAVPAGLLYPEEIARRLPWGDDVVDGDDLFSGRPPRKGALYLPAECGLVEIRPNGSCVVRAEAVFTERDAWSTELSFELLRRAQYLGDWWKSEERVDAAAGGVSS